MNPPTFSLSPDPKELSVLFPPSLADVGFEFPAPAAVPCVANFYKVWKKDSCLLCEARVSGCRFQKDGSCSLWVLGHRRCPDSLSL